MFKKLFSFFWDRSLLFFLIIGALNTLVSMVGSQLLLGALGAATMWEAVFADVGVMVLAILNAMRALKAPQEP